MFDYRRGVTDLALLPSGAPQRDKPSMLANIQALRALAAMMVVVFHLGPRLLSGLGYRSLALQGGVDIFFVISGFVMVHVAGERPAGAFLRDRAVRIMPAYWAATFAMFAALLVARGWEPGMGAHLARSIAFLPGVTETPIFPPLLYVGWTINLELYFYLLFALALALGLRGERRLLLVGALLMVPVLVDETRLVQSNYGAFYGNPIVCEFLAGMLIAQLHRDLARIPAWAGWAMMLAGLSTILFLVDRLPDLHRLLVMGGPAVLIVVGALVLEHRGWQMRSPFVLLLGAASYMLYLVHPILLELTFRLVPDPQGPLAVAVAAGEFAASLALAIALHQRAEVPALRALKQRFGQAGRGALRRVAA